MLAQVTIDTAGGAYTATTSPINSVVGGANSATGGSSSVTTGANTLTTGPSTSQGGAGGAASVGNTTTGASSSTVGNLSTGASTSQGGAGGASSAVTGASTSQGGTSSIGNTSTGASTSTGGSGGSANATGGSSSSSGNVSGNTTITSTYVSPKIPVATAMAPSNFPTAPCMGSSSVGGQAVLFGFSLGSSWEATECMTFEAARSFDQVGMHEDALAIKCTSKYAAAAPSCIKLHQKSLQQVQQQNQLVENKTLVKFLDSDIASNKYIETVDPNTGYRTIIDIRDSYRHPLIGK